MWWKVCSQAFISKNFWAPQRESNPCLPIAGTVVLPLPSYIYIWTLRVPQFHQLFIKILCFHFSFINASLTSFTVHYYPFPLIIPFFFFTSSVVHGHTPIRNCSQKFSVACRSYFKSYQYNCFPVEAALLSYSIKFFQFLWFKDIKRFFFVSE